MKRAGRSLAVLAAVAPVLAACGGDAGPAAEMSSGPPRVETLAELTLTEELRIGSVDDPEVGFSSIGSVDVARDGSVFVLDMQEQQIRAFSPEGELVARIGGPGEGPGEFSGFVHFGVLGDTVWTMDLAANRLTLFERDGDLLSASAVERLRIPLPGTFASVLPLHMEPGGTFLGWMGMVGRARDDPDPGVTEEDDLSWPRVRFDAEGRVTDTVARVHRPPPRLWRPASEEGPGLRFIEIAGQRRLVPNPPTALPRWEPLADGFTVVEAPRPDGEIGSVFVVRVGLTGDTVSATEVHYGARPWREAELDSVAARAARGLGNFVPMGQTPQVPDNWRQIAARLRAEMEFPRYRIGLDYGSTSPDGTVLLAFSSGEDAPERTFVVVDSEGKVQGRLSLPSEVRPRWTDGRTLWVSEPDELGIPWLVRYRIE